MRCAYCRPDEESSASRSSELKPAEWIRRLTAIDRAVRIAKLRFTGGEPLLYRGLEEVVSGVVAKGVQDVALTTNALGLKGRAANLADAGLGRVNISLDSFEPRTFETMTGVRITRALEGIDAAIEAGLVVKLNAVVLRGRNDHELVSMLRHAATLGVELRFLEMMPIGPVGEVFDEEYVSGAEMLARVRSELSLVPELVVPGETSRTYRVLWPDGSTSRCGFVLPVSRPFCEGCTRLRLTSAGELLGCLSQPDSVSLTRAFDAADEGDLAPLRRKVAVAMRVKGRPERFRLQRAMTVLGG